MVTERGLILPAVERAHTSNPGLARTRVAQVPDSSPAPPGKSFLHPKEPTLSFTHRLITMRSFIV